jgi:hypothetical protein
MAINTSQIDLMGGLDEVVMNQRVRAYVPGAGAGVSAPGAQQYGTLWMQGTGVATNFTTGSQTLTAAILGGGLVVGSPAAAVTYTLDTAANFQTYMTANSAGLQVGDILVCDVINAGSSTGVITIAIGTGGSFDSGQNNNLQMPINTSRTLFIKMTALGTSPTYTVYGN